jgi:hypothetical protein
LWAFHDHRLLEVDQHDVLVMVIKLREFDLGIKMKLITDALVACDEVIRDCNKLSSTELRQLIEEYVRAQKKTLEALRKKVN